MHRPSRPLLTTGIPSFDLLLGGGIPHRQSIIVTGDPGCGKTVLCSEVAFATAARGDPAVIATVTSEPHDKLLSELTSFSFFRRELLDEKLFVMSAYSMLKRGAKETRELLLQTVRQRKARLLFIDGLRAIRDLWQNEAQLREFLYELGIALSAADCVGLFTTEYPVEKLLTLPEATTVDGIVSLSVNRRGARRLRRIEVVKLRGQDHFTGEHLLQIGSGGVTVLPRLESQPTNVPDEKITTERACFGLPELDVLMDGGLPVRSSTLLAGSMGIGKTLLAAHFATEGARRGENTLFVSFYEHPSTLAHRAGRVGLDMLTQQRAGTLSFLYQPPEEMEADVVTHQILEEVERRGLKRLVVDGLTELELSIADPERRRTFLAAFTLRLRLAGVTTLFTREVPKVVGSELDFSDAPVASVGENVLLLRFVELRGRVHRILSILKMRDSKYDSEVREFEIADSGMRVLAPLRSAQGLLTGQARPIGSAIGGEG